MESYARQIIDFQKTTFDNTYNTMVQIQDQAEKVTVDVIAQMHWAPEEMKKAMDDSINMFKSARDDYKKAMDDGFEKIESFLCKS